jgi:peptidoglycan/LPS O-acetylase OafA/YrhL
MVHAWLPNFVESWNNASWSISCEWFVYLIFPVLVLSRMHRLPNWIAGALTVLLPAIFIGLVQTGYTGLFTPLIQVVCEFAAGCLLYRIYIRQSAGKFTANLLMPAALGSTLTVLALLWRQPQMAGHWLVLTFPLLILAIARSNRLAGRALASRPALYWGRVSYSLYMTHSVTLWPLKAFFPLRESAGFAHRIGLACIWIGSIAVVAALTYHFVEEPARHWMRGKSPFAKRVAANRAAPERTQ